MILPPKAFLPATLLGRLGVTNIPPERLDRFALAAVVLVLAYVWPLINLVRFAFSSDLYSHIILVPFISLYLAWLKRTSLPVESNSTRSWAFAFLAGGGAVLLGYWFALLTGSQLPRADALVLTISSFLLLFCGLCFFYLGLGVVRALVFPLSFLIFILPIPTFALAAIEAFLQRGSADVAQGLLLLAGTPFFRQDLVFQLPGITIQVAPECSGIHSSIALLITSLLAGYFFLRSPVRRAVLTVAVVPLALARNGFRIFTISELCVHIGPEMIDSPVHHHGGPLFFALSLVPFGLLLLYLIKTDRKTGYIRRAPSP